MHGAKLRMVFVVLMACVVCRPAFAQQPTTLADVVDRVVAQEQAEIQSVRRYSPLVEIYVQQLRPDAQLGTVPDGDQYFLGRAQFAKGVDVEPLTSGGSKNKSFWTTYVPRGFLDMIYPDTNGFDRKHYKFDFVRREFVGEIRCFVFDLTPDNGKGRFLGRIWVEDQTYHIVRFNGAFGGSSSNSAYFHFDSWRVNAGGDQWLPALIYSEQGDATTKKVAFKSQTRLWGYNLNRPQQEQDLSKILAEEPLPAKDQAGADGDVSPLEAQAAWDQQAEDNVIDRMDRMGLLAPRGEVDKVLETVVNNIEVTNNLDIQPEIRCRVLMTSTLESFTVGHTIVLSRGLIDVLPDEGTLATMLALEMGHVVLGHRLDPQYAFFDRMLFDERDTFQHFGFARTPEEERAANDKAAELLKNSPYKDQLATSQLFLQALQSRSQQIPNLISPHLGDSVPTGSAISAGASTAQAANPSANASPARDTIVALPLGGRIKLDPWSDQLQMLKSKSTVVAERERLPFEVTPFMLYLTRSTGTPAAAPGAVAK